MIYTYKCPHCNHYEDKHCSIEERDDQVCSKCGEPTEKQISDLNWQWSKGMRVKYAEDFPDSRYYDKKTAQGIKEWESGGYNY